MRRVSFEQRAFREYNEWSRMDRRIHRKIIELIEAIIRDPFDGIGKPEPLRHELGGHWSRRITEEHRLIYEVREDQIIIVSCKEHY